MRGLILTVGGFVTGAAAGIAASLVAATCTMPGGTTAAGFSALAAPPGGVIRVTHTCEDREAAGAVGRVRDNMWYGGGYDAWRALRECSHRDWYHMAIMDNDGYRNVVEASPSIYRAFGGVQVRRLHTARAGYSQAGQGGDYEDAFDIWLGEAAGTCHTRIMIWTDDHGMSPRGSAVARATIDGRQYVVWATDGPGGTISFVATRNSASGVLNLLSFFGWATGRHWISPYAVLRKVAYKAEVVPAGGAPWGIAATSFWVRTA